MRSLTRTALLALSAGMVATGCAHLPGTGVSAFPLLAPSALHQDVSRSQRLSVSRLGGDGAALTLDAVVEVDAQALRVAAFLLGQRVLMVVWDGQQLQEDREPVVPAALRGADVLRDLQLVYWPADAIRPALPPGWRLEGDAANRRLLRGERLMVETQRTRVDEPLGTATLVNHAAGYRIVIEAAKDSAP